MNYYFHVPFCTSKCGYCAFYSLPGAGEKAVDAYLDRLERTFEPAGPAETVYIGGGTPTYLSEKQLERFFGVLRSRLTFEPGAEISCEANPESLTPGKTALLRENITRLSMGVQSFDAAVRKNIGRNCSDEALENALSLVRKAAFPHWNMDLIFALPGQSDEAFFKGAERAVQSGADHISCYALTAEENAALKLPEDDERAALMMPQIAEYLAQRGVDRYEISNFARPGCQCRHNVNVWRGGLLSGYGPTACGFDGKDRFTHGTLDEWLEGKEPEKDIIAPGARLNEIFAVNLRTSAGWTPELWCKVPGADSWQKRLELIEKVADSLDKNWFIISQERIALTGDGLMFWNNVAGEIFDYGA
jgi:oxygen-independent coproporphyrinogen-3 oxidase